MSSKFALLIANTEYQDAKFAKLTAPGKDAEEFAQVLREPELAAFDEVQVLLNDGENKIRRAIARFFAERKRDDLLLLYFSGHGIRNEHGHLFLAASDTEIGILEATGIPAEFVTNAMNNSRSQRQVLILDCCNGGAFAYGSKSASAIGKSMGIATAFEGSGFGRAVLTATDATQYAWEGDKVIGDTQKSVFTHFLIEGLKGEADRNGDGRIDVDELYDYTFEQVVRRTPKQTPGKWSYKQQGDIILLENLKPHNVKPAPLPPDLLDLLSHPNSSVRKVGVQDLTGLLDSKRLRLARAAEEKLRELAATDDSLALRKTAGELLSARGLTLEQSMPGEIPDVPNKSLGRRITISKHDKRLLGRILGISLMIVFLGWAVRAIVNNWSTFSSLTMATPTRTPLPTKTAIPPAPTLGIGSTIAGRDGMTLLYVPAGEFTMGSDNGDYDERPVHEVYLDSFWIDQTEVTNRMYYLCVKAGKCKEPVSTRSSTRPNYYGSIFVFDNYPVINVDWNMAETYCQWVNRRLPTEAQWEKAARGEDARTYPWGNEEPNNNLLNYNSAVGDTTEVGTYSNGTSLYGALDIVGNVWEWVADWYSGTYYENSPASNPLGPVSGEYRVLRGGAWRSSGNYVRSADREENDPTYANSDIGFRCAASQSIQAGLTPLVKTSTVTPEIISSPTGTSTPTP